MISFLLILVLVAVMLNKYLSFYSDYWEKRNVKQAKGILLKFARRKQSLSEIYKEIYEAHPTLPHVGVFFGLKPVLILRDKENIQAVLHGDFQSFNSRGFIVNRGDFLGDNMLFTDDYYRWKLIKQKISPIITTANIKNLFCISERCARDFVIYIKENPQITEDPLKAIFMYTTACISSTVFGINDEIQNTMNTPSSDVAYESVKPSWRFNLKFLISIMAPKVFSWLGLKAFKAYEDMVTNALKNVMDKRLNDNRKHNDFIDLCLKLQKEGVIRDTVTGYEINVTLEFLAAQTLNFIIGGIDTSAYALHYTLLELSNNPEILKKVHDEIDEIFKCNADVLTFEDIEKMEYTEKVISEAVRKYPPIGLIPRRCCKDTVLPVGGVKLEKDMIVIVPTYGIHWDEKYYPKPEIFDPERFSPDNFSKLPRHSYLPFGDGKRMCIGQRFSRMEMKTCLAWLLRYYTLKANSYTPKRFEPSVIALRDPNAYYEIVPRNP